MQRFSLNFYILAEKLNPDSRAVENWPVFITHSLIISEPLRVLPREVNTKRHRGGLAHGLNGKGKKQGRFNSKHTKTFQSFPSPLNISCSLKAFLWSQRPQSGTSLEERSFTSVLALPNPLFSLNNKSFYLTCSSEPRRRYETWSSAIRATIRTQTWIALSHHFCGCLIITFMSASDWDPTQVSFRQVKSHCPFFFHFRCVWAIVCYQ